MAGTGLRETGEVRDGLNDIFASFLVFFHTSHHYSKRRGEECEGSALPAPTPPAVGDDTGCFLLALCSDQ